MCVVRPQRLQVALGSDFGLGVLVTFRGVGCVADSSLESVVNGVAVDVVDVDVGSRCS